MIVHRDYRDSSASIIKIFDNRIEFYNPGKLYDGITVQDLLSGEYTSRSRNKLIAKAFKEAGMIERYGSGIMRVRKICKEYGIKEPDFDEIFNGFQVILYNEKIVIADEEREVEETMEKTMEKTVEKTVEKAVEKTVEKLIAIIKEKPNITIKKLAELTGLSRRGIEWNIQQLKSNGLIERVGTDRSGYWKITEKENNENRI
jgi:ATP-dependent DNA helicase RecG